MKLNCKPGDLALIVESTSGNEGKIVRCIKRSGDEVWRCPDGSLERMPSWDIDIKLPEWRGGFVQSIPDKQLRPLRDQDGEDEMTRIAGLPNKESSNV